MTKAKGTGFHIGTWNGLDNYECDFCPYATPGADGLTLIKRHVGGHFLRGEAPLLESTLDFASPQAADLFETYNEELQEAVAVLLMESGGDGLAGSFTVADVREAHAALTTEKE